MCVVKVLGKSWWSKVNDNVIVCCRPQWCHYGISLLDWLLLESSTVWSCTVPFWAELLLSVLFLFIPFTCEDARARRWLIHEAEISNLVITLRIFWHSDIRRDVWPAAQLGHKPKCSAAVLFWTSSVRLWIVEMNKLLASLFSLDLRCFLFSSPRGPAASFLFVCMKVCSVVVYDLPVVSLYFRFLRALCVSVCVWAHSAG